ncbi:unnamed protein product, partial [Rhizoctonia solani]
MHNQDTILRLVLNHIIQGFQWFLEAVGSCNCAIGGHLVDLGWKQKEMAGTNPSQNSIKKSIFLARPAQRPGEAIQNLHPEAVHFQQGSPLAVISCPRKNK